MRSPHRAVLVEREVVSAPPRKLGTALPPVAALPLPQNEGGVAVVVGVLVEADRNLPADVRLPVERTLTASHGRLVQGTGAVLETGTVQEDASIVDRWVTQPPSLFLKIGPPISAARAVPHRAQADRSALGSTVDPPCRRNGRRGCNTVLVLGANSVKTRAALAVDAAIVRGEKGQVELPRVAVFVIEGPTRGGRPGSRSCRGRYPPDRYGAGHG